MVELKVNGVLQRVDVDPATPLLWVLRDHLGLKGTKFSCGIGQCGSCTVRGNGTALRSCILPVAGAAGMEIETIEGLNHPVQAAWIAEQVPQCGWCQSGQLLAAAALLEQTPQPTDEDLDRQVTNLCRCATYPRIRRAIHRAAAALPPASSQEPQGEPAAAEDEPLP